MSFELEKYMTPGEAQQIDMIRLKARFRQMGIIRYMDHYISEYPDSADPAAQAKVRSVWTCDTMDIIIINRFQKLYDKLSKIRTDA